MSKLEGEIVTFMKSQPEYKEGLNWLSHIFRYNGVMCGGLVTVLPYTYQLRIMPCRMSDDIGAGPGQTIYKDFKRQSATEKQTMKTKEEILDSQVDNGCSGGTKTATDRYGRFDSRIIYAAMDEYAKQVAIAFDDWTAYNHVKYQKGGTWICASKVYEQPPTTEQLYTQFIEQQSQNK